jgi:oxygen-independent coproporphyrinogen-3 oxidase
MPEPAFQKFKEQAGGRLRVWEDLPPDLKEASFGAESCFGIYVHVPFCAWRCGYCDFAAFDRLDHLMSDYVEALVIEISRSRQSLEEAVAEASGTTLYFGGGTPSRLPVALFERIVSELSWIPFEEVSLEANPEDICPEKARAWAECGVSRVSLGVQSFDRSVLDYLQRRHTAFSVIKAVETLRSHGIEDINLDLIYGAPPETPASWEITLRTALDLLPTHLSCYALTVEAATPLGVEIKRGKALAPDPSHQAMLLDIGATVLQDAGFVRYEVSSWAKPGRYCRHNLIYWGFGSYRGFGSGAHSFVGGRRFWNLRHPASYIQAIYNAKGSGDRGDSLPSGFEHPDASTALLDYLSMTARRRVGVDMRRAYLMGLHAVGEQPTVGEQPIAVADSYTTTTGLRRIQAGRSGEAPVVEFPRTDRLVGLGLAERSGWWVRATSSGMAVLNDLIVALVLDIEELVQAQCPALSVAHALEAPRGVSRQAGVSPPCSTLSV